MRINSSRSQIKTRSFWLRRPTTEALVQLHSYLHIFHKAEQFAFSWKQYYFGSIYANTSEKWVDRQVELQRRWKNNIVDFPFWMRKRSRLWSNPLNIASNIWQNILFSFSFFIYLMLQRQTNFVTFLGGFSEFLFLLLHFLSCDALTFSCWLWICCWHARAKMQFAL